jgi:choloylglycine hydrolase
MRKPFLLLVVVCLMLPVQENKACTAFFLEQSGRMVVAKNLDWPVDLGYVLYNPAGKKKEAFHNDGPTRPFQWTAQYSSITFNQFGVGFPLGGMNSRGLVVEELNMPRVRIEKDTTRRQLNEFQLVQFLLDHCANVEEVVKRLKHLHYAPLVLHLHYFVADQTGKTAILEFDGTRWQTFFPEKPEHAVLSNNPYHESLRYLENFKGFGGEMPVIHRQGSNERFVSAAHMIQSGYQEDTRQQAFRILDTVKQEDTRWSIVYYITERKVFFRFHNCRQQKVFHLKKLMNQDTDYIPGCSLKNCRCTNEEGFHAVTPEENSALLKNLEKNLSRYTGFSPTDTLLPAMARWGNRFLTDQSGAR